MSAKFFVDTNILMYAHDPGWGAKHTKALQLVQELWSSGEGALSTQVLQELAVNIRKKSSRPFSTAETKRLIEDYLEWHIIENDAKAVLEALTMEEQYRISFWDALMLHAAMKAGANVVYSEDLADGQKYGSVQVVNPLKN